MKRVRAVQFNVQPVLVVDEKGGELEALPVDPFVVTATDWPTFATEKWPDMLAATEKQLNATEPAERPD